MKLKKWEHKKRDIDFQFDIFTSHFMIDKHSVRKRVIYALILMLSSIQYGIIYVFTSPTSDEIHELFHMSDSDLRWSLYNAALHVGAFIITFFLSKILRLFHNSRKKLTIATHIYIFAFLLLNLSLTYNIWIGIVARVMLGLGIGVTSYLIPMYLVEIAPPQYSQAFGSLQELGVNFGSILLYFLGGVTSTKWLTVFGIVETIVAFGLSFLLPESPAALEDPKYFQILKNVKSVSIFQKKYLRV